MLSQSKCTIQVPDAKSGQSNLIITDITSIT